MSTYEKIATAVIVILAFALIILWRGGEERQPQHAELQSSEATSDFDESIGPDFQIGPFTYISQNTSGGIESGCDTLQPVIVAALHDIYRRINENIFPDGNAWDSFEVNQAALAAFCNKNAKLVLQDKSGNRLLLQKVPFTRAVPPNGAPVDIGTEVRIDASFIRSGSSSTEALTSADVLIPDRYLDATSSIPGR